MAKRDINYTSISISKTHLHYIADLKEYAQQELGQNITGQVANDFALEIAWEHRKQLPDFLEKHKPDPRVAAFKKLYAELAAEGKLPPTE